MNHKIIQVKKDLRGHQVQPSTKSHQPTEPYCEVPRPLVFEHLQGWSLHHFPGEPVPMLNQPFSEEFIPNIQPEPLLV